MRFVSFVMKTKNNETMKQYFKLCLLSPIWLPAIILLGNVIYEALDLRFFDGLPDWLAVVGFVLAWSVIVGGVQYVVSLLIVWRLIDFDDYFSWRKWVLLLPLIFGCIFSGGLSFFILWSARNITDFFEFGYVGFLAGAVGYAYVLLWLAGFELLRMSGRFERRRGAV